MELTIRGVNQSLARACSAVGYCLWRDTLRHNQNYYSDRAVTAEHPLARYNARVMATGLAGALYVRDGVTFGRTMDRVTGTGWDDARPPTGGTPTASASDPDIVRLDLGKLHRTVAEYLGGSDAAVLAVHPIFFSLRMTRHAFVGVITATGFVPGCLVGAIQGAFGRVLWQPG